MSSAWVQEMITWYPRDNPPTETMLCLVKRRIVAEVYQNEPRYEYYVDVAQYCTGNGLFCSVNEPGVFTDVAYWCEMPEGPEWEVDDVKP